MRYAVFSDIHANLQAWEAIHQDMVRLEADVLVCLGDVVGYGPKPEEVLAAIREATPNFVMGNHDAAAVGMMDTKLFNRNAESAIKWTRKQLGAESKQFLRERPLTIKDDRLFFVHAEISEPGLFRYIESEDDARANLADDDHFITFVGHTHHPKIFDLDEDGSVYTLPDTDRQLDINHRYLINVGSVGEPRNPKDIRAHYVIYDSDTRDVYFRRVEFDIEAYRKDLESTSLKGRPYFLQVADHHAALEAEAGYAMAADMRPPEGSEEYLRQFREGGASLRKTAGATRTGSGSKPKPRPASTERHPVRMILFRGFLIFLILGIATLKLFWPEPPKERRPAPTLADVPPPPRPREAGPVSPEPALPAPPPTPLIAKVDPPPPPVPPEPVPEPPPPAPDPKPLPEPEPPAPPVPDPPSPPVPAPDPEPPAPEVLAYWRFDEKVGTASPTDEAGAHPLLVVKSGRTFKALAPNPIPLTGQQNLGALAAGAWRELDLSGKFELEPDRSLTFEGWLMTSGAQEPIAVASTRAGEGRGWQIDVRAASNADSLGSIRFVHHGATGSTTVQANDIELFAPDPHHFAVVWNHERGGAGKGILSLYFDGLRLAEAEIAHEELNARSGEPGALTIGNERNPAGFALDELRFSAGALEPSQFLSRGEGRLVNRKVALLIDVGPKGKLYKGNDSPAHAEGAIARNHAHWTLASPDNVDGPPPPVLLASGEAYGIPISIEVGEVGSQLSGNPFVSIPPFGAGSIFGSELMDSAADPEGAGPAGIRVRGLEPGRYTVYFTPVVSERLDEDVEFGLGVDLAGDSEIATSTFARGMRRWRYRAGAATADDKRWVDGRNYFRQNLQVTHPEDYVVAIVSNGEDGMPASIPYLQIVKVGDSKLRLDPPIDFRFEGEEPTNDAAATSAPVANITPMFAEGFLEPVKLLPRPSGGKAAAGEIDNPSSLTKDYFHFAFDVVGKGAILSGFSFEVGANAELDCEVSLHDETGRRVELLCEGSAVRPALTWRGRGTLAGLESLGIRLSPETYTIRISGSNTAGRSQLQIDNVKVDFEEL